VRDAIRKEVAAARAQNIAHSWQAMFRAVGPKEPIMEMTDFLLLAIVALLWSLGSEVAGIRRRLQDQETERR